jgi:NAD(P)-dependent dehydrogenase (short-subunit alcohol dehydrogenase family)
MKINLLGPMLLAKHFLPFLPRRGTKIPAIDDEAMTGLPRCAIMALLSARVGSISDNRRGGWYSYRCTKAGVTQLAKTLDHHLVAQSGENAMSVALHPGTVKTNLSKGFWESEGSKANKGRGLFEAETAARQLIDVLRGLKPEQGKGRGGFWDWQGEAVLP